VASLISDRDSAARLFLQKNRPSRRFCAEKAPKPKKSRKYLHQTKKFLVQNIYNKLNFKMPYVGEILKKCKITKIAQKIANCLGAFFKKKKRQ